MKTELELFKGRPIVVDTRSDWVYIGIFDQITSDTLILTDADAHDISDTDASKEFYIFDAKRNGVKANRDRVFVRLDLVVGFSALEEIKGF